MARDEQITYPDGSLDFSGGVNSYAVTTIQSERNPHGLKRNQLAWMNNCTVRQGGILQRTGWQPTGKFHDGSAIYQGGFLYEPDSGNPYFIVSVGGRIFRFDPDHADQVVDLSAASGLTNPAAVDQAFFCQAEQFLIIQAGDGTTLPLFWDGATLRRSKGITNTAVAPGTPGVNEIPAATCMDYYMNRLWYAQGRSYSAGDIVKGPSGTLAYGFRDAVLNVTENPLVVGGDGFTVPTNAGNIRALKHPANLDAAMGQGRLYIFTRKEVYSLTVPVTRTDWIGADNNNQPQQTVVQITNGAVNDRSVVAVNGDLYFQSLEPAIRSLVTAVRYFEQPGNVPISINEVRLTQFNDRSLMRFSSGIEFSNRLLQLMLPEQTANTVIHKAIVPLNFDVISTLEEKLPQVWEGMYEGVDFMQLFAGDFGGRERAFGAVLSREDNSFQCWELTDFQKFENGDNRVTWQIEFPAFTWGQEFKLKKLVSAEIWVDKLFGEVMFNMQYRPDSDACWYDWHAWKECTARNSCEDVINPICYPLQEYREGYRATMTLPLPPRVCAAATGRPSNIAYQFQPRLTIKGWCRIRGVILHAEFVEQALYRGMVC